MIIALFVIALIFLVARLIYVLKLNQDQASEQVDEKKSDEVIDDVKRILDED